jgi:hypothetical protein
MTDDLTALRSTVAQLDRSERLALAALLIGQCNTRFGQVIGSTDTVFGGGLDIALVATNDLSQQQKLAFAIELLELQIDQDAPNKKETENQ